MLFDGILAPTSIWEDAEVKGVWPSVLVSVSDLMFLVDGLDRETPWSIRAPGWCGAVLDK